MLFRVCAYIVSTGSGNTVTVVHTLPADAYQSGDDVTYKVWIATGDEVTVQAIICTGAAISCARTVLLNSMVQHTRILPL